MDAPPAVKKQSGGAGKWLAIAVAIFLLAALSAILLIPSVRESIQGVTKKSGPSETSDKSFEKDASASQPESKTEEDRESAREGKPKTQNPFPPAEDKLEKPDSADVARKEPPDENLKSKELDTTRPSPISEDQVDLNPLESQLIAGEDYEIGTIRRPMRELRRLKEEVGIDIGLKQGARSKFRCEKVKEQLSWNIVTEKGEAQARVKFRKRDDFTKVVLIADPKAKPLFLSSIEDQLTVRVLFEERTLAEVPLNEPEIRKVNLTFKDVLGTPSGLPVNIGREGEHWVFDEASRKFVQSQVDTNLTSAREAQNDAGGAGNVKIRISISEQTLVAEFVYPEAFSNDLKLFQRLNLNLTTNNEYEWQLDFNEGCKYFTFLDTKKMRLTIAMNRFDDAIKKAKRKQRQKFEAVLIDEFGLLESPKEVDNMLDTRDTDAALVWAKKTFQKGDKIHRNVRALEAYYQERNRMTNQRSSISETLTFFKILLKDLEIPIQQNIDRPLVNEKRLLILSNE